MIATHIKGEIMRTETNNTKLLNISWDENYKDIGVYRLILELDDGTEREMTVWDNTCDYQKRENAKDPVHARYNPSGFKVSYCHGYSMEEFFDDTHTLEEVKEWAENYLLDGLINRYKDLLDELDPAKRRAEWAAEYKLKRTK